MKQFWFCTPILPAAFRITIPNRTQNTKHRKKNKTQRRTLQLQNWPPCRAHRRSSSTTCRTEWLHNVQHCSARNSSWELDILAVSDPIEPTSHQRCWSSFAEAGFSWDLSISSKFLWSHTIGCLLQKHASRRKWSPNRGADRNLPVCASQAHRHGQGILLQN